MVEKFIIDTDIGDDIDDAYALAFLSQVIKERVVGITTVFKNTEQRAKLVSHFLKLLDWNIPVAAGESKPLKKEISFLPFEKVCENPEITQYRESYKDEKYSSENAVDFILDSIKKYDCLSLVCIGPLTNIALAIQKEPETFKKVKRLVIMGGTFSCKYVEWNVKCDPEAFEMVVNSGVKLQFVGHDITKNALFNQKDVDFLLTLKSKPLELLNDTTTKYLEYYDHTRLPCMHDPLTVSVLTKKFVKFKKGNLSVDMKEKPGLCILGETGVPIEYAVKARNWCFKKYLIKKLISLDRKSK